MNPVLRLFAATLAACAWGFTPVAALAEPPGPPERVYSSGPLRMQDGEHVTFGFLVPAVQRARSDAQFELLDGKGGTVFTFTPKAGGPSFVDVTFRANPTGQPGGSVFEVTHGIGNPDFVPAGTEGILIGLLVPAVQRNGQTVDPTAASMQTFDVNGGTKTHSAMGWFFPPGPPNNRAQPPGPPEIFSAGPFRMHDGEHVTFGFLVPAVQRARSDAQFQLLDSGGTAVFTGAPAPGGTSFFDVTFHAKPFGKQTGPSFEISHGIGNPDLVPAGTDGILIGLLVPAVQKNSQVAGPSSASMQSFDVNGGTLTHTFLNGYPPGPPSHPGMGE